MSVGPGTLHDKGRQLSLEQTLAQRAVMRVKLRNRFRSTLPTGAEAFLRDVLAADPYNKQQEILQAVEANRRVSVVGCNGSGKDWTTGRLPLWWLTKYDQAKVVVIGPTTRQVDEILWRETRLAFNQAKARGKDLGGRMLPVKPLWTINDERFAIGFSTDNPFNITGFHSPHLLVIITEAHAVAQPHITAAKNLNPERLILTGNPMVMGGEFFDSHHRLRDQYGTVSISAFDSPNVIEGRTVVPGLITREDVAEKLRDWGKDDPRYIAGVLGQFPDSLEDSIIPLSWAIKANDLPWVRFEEGAGPKLIGGLDVAGPGEDKTVLTLRQGPNLLGMQKWTENDPRGQVVAALLPFKDQLDYINVDSTGIGYYFAAHLRDAGFPVSEINAGERADDPERFANLKAEQLWGLRMRVFEGDLRGAGLLDQETLAQMATVRWSVNPRGQTVIESKEDLARRGISSPDEFESLALAFAPDNRIHVSFG